jgi:glycosyltransferase involved in cell wall biosynthesis
MMTEKQSNKKVFVFLGYGFGADSWQQRFVKHQIPGLNERLPYGYYHAAGDGWVIEYSQDRKESPVTRLLRRTVGRVLGFDLIHALRNRKQLQSADVVWTHTEREHLAVLFLNRLQRVKDPPKLIAQCVWLFDRWSSFSSTRRWCYRQLLKRADVITTQSPDDQAAARRLFPTVATELILSGAAVDGLTPPQRGPAHRPIRLAALGNDMHRDWETLVCAFGGAGPSCEVRIASSKINRELLRNLPNFSIVRASSEHEIKKLYEWADIVVVPLKFNLHVSGITVVFEAIVSGVPVVCTDVGGMRAYFSDSEIRYVPLGSQSEMRRAVEMLADNDDERFQLAVRSQARLFSSHLTKQGYAHRHLRLSESLLCNQRLSARKRVVGVDSIPAVRSEEKVRVFVHLGHGFGAASWKRRYSRGLIPGLNEPLPYGYFRAADDKWLIEHSEDKQESRLTQLFRRGLQWTVGFDLIHAWRNRGQMRDADVVWTHTEREHLAVLLLWRITRNHKRPRIIAQCIWLFDRWPRLPRWKQRLYLVLLNQADIVTTLSTRNLERARMLLPTKKCESLLFGVDSGVPRMVARQEINKPIKLLALGNDMHRDWKTLLGAFGDLPDYDVRLASNSVPHSLIKGVANVCLRLADTEDELMAMYKWADVVVVPLKDNLHASGITVVLEATLFGLPVICSDTGGMRTYFSDGEIRYVPVADRAAMRSAVDEIAANDNFRRKLISKAQERIRSLDLTAQGFVDRHRKLSEKILFDAADQSAFPARVA